jgi:hypothetical protein
MPADSAQSRSKGFTAGRLGVVYLIANLVFAMLAAYGSSESDAPIGRLLFLCPLFALCTAPLLMIRAFNDRYALLGMFMAVYFVNYGMADFIALLTHAPLSSPADLMTPAELGILLGAAVTIGGYLMVAARVPRISGQQVGVDWSQATVLGVGLLLSLSGTLAFAYFHLVAVTVNTNQATESAFTSLGPIMVFLVMLGQLIRPVGLLILAYGYAKFRGVPWLVLIIVALLSQVVLGFVGDTKGLPIQAGLLVILAKTLVENRLPRMWILGGAVAIAVIFPIFQAYRTEVVGERGMNRAQAAMNIGKALELSLAAKEKVTEGKPGVRAQNLFERASTKGNVELVFDHVGVDSPFQNGRTLVELVLAFIPRLVWPDKPSVATGQLFNKQVVHGFGDTYISPSHLGELYWNFGWPGVVVGMMLIGMLLGFIGAKSSLAERLTATRLMILLATIATLCVQFESGIAVTYVVWIRSLAAIGLLQWMFGRQRRPATADSAAQLPVPAAESAEVPVGVSAGVVVPQRLAARRGSGVGSLPRYPNLLR